MKAKEAIKKLLRVPAKALLASAYDYLEGQIAKSPSVWLNPYLSAKMRPYRSSDDSFVIKKSDFPRVDGDPSSLPVPPKGAGFYKYDKIDEYLATGKQNVDTMRRIAEASGFSFEAADRILDFGCGDGRLIRWFSDIADKGEVWGVDIVGQFIMLCQQYLSPPFRFATITSDPHLPFEDRSFDFIYAGSVFTHIADLADAWLLELKRILRPGGRLYVTVHDDHTIAMCLDPERHLDHYREKLESLERQEPFLNSAWDWLTVHRAPGPGGYREAQVFHNTDYLRRHWGSMFKVLSITPGCFHGLQSAYLLEKPVTRRRLDESRLHQLSGVGE
jgi:ubiquinone/menaquinone biosynthesis C-methylase UbiE